MREQKNKSEYEEECLMRNSKKLRKVVALMAAITMIFQMSMGSQKVFAAEDEYTIEDSFGEGQEDVAYIEEEAEDGEDWDESEVELSDDELTLKPGQSYKLSVDGDYDSVKWRSTKSSVVKVSNTGMLKAVKSGKAIIYADVTYTSFNLDDADEADENDFYIESLNDGEDEVYYTLEDMESEDGQLDWDEEEESTEETITLECEVTVKNGTVAKISKTKLKLKAGKSAKLSVKGAKGTVKWKSSKKAVAVVSKSGKVLAKKKGTAVVSAKVNGKTLKCKVSVK